jgi:hypothetical protein
MALKKESKFKKKELFKLEEKNEFLNFWWNW